MNRKRPREIQTEHVPADTANMMHERTRAIVRHCCLYEQNIIEAIALSCYLQGLIDGTQVAHERPEVLRLLWDADDPLA